MFIRFKCIYRLFTDVIMLLRVDAWPVSAISGTDCVGRVAGSKGHLEVTCTPRVSSFVIDHCVYYSLLRI